MTKESEKKIEAQVINLEVSISLYDLKRVSTGRKERKRLWVTECNMMQKDE